MVFHCNNRTLIRTIYKYAYESQNPCVKGYIRLKRLHALLVHFGGFVEVIHRKLQGQRTTEGASEEGEPQRGVRELSWAVEVLFNYTSGYTTVLVC